MCACGAENKTTNLYSHQFKGKAQRLKKLKEYLNEDTGWIAAEYHIWYQDNETGLVPGPSDYTIKLALKIEADSIDSWIYYLQPSDKNVSIKNWEDLNLEGEEWTVESVPEVYFSSLQTEVKVVYRKERVILAIYSTTMPVDLKE